VAHHMATMEDLHRLCPWAALATHDVERSLVMLSVFFFSAFCSEGLLSVRNSGLYGYCMACSPIGLVWRSSVLLFCCAVPTPSLRSSDALALAPVSHRFFSKEM